MKLTEQVQQESETSYTSLIDIVFLLLVFFMCATQFKQVERRLDAFLPDIGPGPMGEIEEELSIFVKDDPEKSVPLATVSGFASPTSVLSRSQWSSFHPAAGVAVTSASVPTS